MSEQVFIHCQLEGKKMPSGPGRAFVLQNTKTFSWLFCSPDRAVNSQQLGSDHLLRLPFTILREAGRERVFAVEMAQWLGQCWL